MATRKRLKKHDHCTRPGCMNTRGQSTRYCRDHHNESMREWRKTHRLHGEARKRANARSYLHVYIKRGKIVRQPCEVCGASPAHGHHDDYNKPLKVRWLCKKHHLEHHKKAAAIT